MASATRCQRTTAFVLGSTAQQAPHVVVRDTPPNQEINAGFAIIANTSVGRAFLRMVLEKRSWFSLPLMDQDAFTESMLELAGHGRYPSTCMRYIWLPPGKADYSVLNYASCWQEWAEELFGKWRE